MVLSSLSFNKNENSYANLNFSNNLNYAKDNDEWTLSSNSLANEYKGKNTIDADGFKLSFFGQPLDGDEFSLKPLNSSKAISMWTNNNNNIINLSLV